MRKYLLDPESEKQPECYGEESGGEAVDPIGSQAFSTYDTP